MSLYPVTRGFSRCRAAPLCASARTQGPSGFPSGVCVLPSQAKAAQAEHGLAEANAASEGLRAELATAAAGLEAAGKSAEAAAAAKEEAEAQLERQTHALAAAQEELGMLSAMSKVGVLAGSGPAALGVS